MARVNLLIFKERQTGKKMFGPKYEKNTTVMTYIRRPHIRNPVYLKGEELRNGNVTSEGREWRTEGRAKTTMSLLDQRTHKLR